MFIIIIIITIFAFCLLFILEAGTQRSSASTEAQTTSSFQNK